MTGCIVALFVLFMNYTSLQGEVNDLEQELQRVKGDVDEVSNNQAQESNSQSPQIIQNNNTNRSQEIPSGEELQNYTVDRVADHPQ